MTRGGGWLWDREQAKNRLNKDALEKMPLSKRSAIQLLEY